MEIRLPNLGEGVTQATVVAIHVAVGDSVDVDQTIVELETEKAVAPIPSTSAGKVTQILVKEGDKVSEGQPILSLDGDGASSTSATAEPSTQSTSTPVAASIVQPQAPASPQSSFQYHSPSGMPPAASPTVRKMARELGIDLTRVRGTESGGRISVHDLRDYIQALQQAALSGGSVQTPSQESASTKPKVSIDFSKWGEVKKEKVSSLRKIIAERMHTSWSEIPHITQFDDADMTQTLALRKKLMPSFEKEGLRLTVTALIIKAVVKALKEHPIFNASLDEATDEIVFKDYYHIGIAVDTDNGLIVPVLKDADKKSLMDVSKELSALAQKTRDRKVAPDDLKGGSFTISNLGGIGGTYFTPIINQPEAAILALGKSGLKPVVNSDTKKVEARVVMPVGVSYDHRIIDGADAARFITTLVQTINNLKESDLK